MEPTEFGRDRARHGTDVQDPPRTAGSTLVRLGPGVIIAGSIVGSGELIATTKVGAEAGFWLLWLIVIGCMIKVFAQVEIGRYTVTWGRTALSGLNAVPGPRFKVNWIVWSWLLMTILVLSQQGGIVGGVGQALSIARPLTHEGRAFHDLGDRAVEAQVKAALLRLRGSGDPQAVSRLEAKAEALAKQIAALPQPVDAHLWTIAAAVLTSVVLFIGRYRLIQTVSLVLVSAFTLVTIVTLLALQAQPDWGVSGEEVIQGLRFQLPPIMEGLTRTPVATALAAFGIIGVGAFELIMYPYWVLEKGYATFTGPRDGSRQWIDRARGWIRVMYADAWLSMIVYTFATVAFYLLGSAVLGRSGLNPENEDFIRTLAQMYVPVFGSWAHTLFLFGAVAVLYSTFFVACAGVARMVADALGLFGLTDGSEASRSRWSHIMSGVVPLTALAIYLLLRAPVAMILASGICQAIMLPVLGGAALYFRYRRCDPLLRPGRLWDAFLWLSFAGFLIVAGWTAVATFLPDLTKL